VGLLRDDERPVVEALAALADTNPFVRERVECERRALGERFVPSQTVWHVDGSHDGLNPNTEALVALAEERVEQLRDRLVGDAAARAGKRDLTTYEQLCRFVLYMRYEDDFMDLIRRAEQGERTTGRVAAFARFRRDFDHWLGLDGVRLPIDISAGDLFAWGFQIRRAFHLTFRRIYGGSMPAAALRAAVWQSIFTHDFARYRRALVHRMGDIPTLITGETGTGKELVARAIGASRFVPFDEERRAFSDDFATAFQAVNLSALSPTLIESELFGHRRGAYTGALEDRAGWLEECRPLGSVFLDEIGELAPEIQVKLLRVLQSRTFQRIGETDERRFEGKILAATNRDLPAEIEAGRFRADLFYRLRADAIETPTLRAQIADAPEHLNDLLLILARRIAGDEEAPGLVDETARWIERELPDDYPWPGNVRELEQCVRSILVRGSYTPATPGAKQDDLASAIDNGDLTAEELLSRYCTHIYERTGSYEETGRRLNLDRRTVKAKIRGRS
jgi:hypothetical protein